MSTVLMLASSSDCSRYSERRSWTSWQFIILSCLNKRKGQVAISELAWPGEAGTLRCPRGLPGLGRPLHRVYLEDLSARYSSHRRVRGCSKRSVLDPEF